jgi:hypothetical protein
VRLKTSLRNALDDVFNFLCSCLLGHIDDHWRSPGIDLKNRKAAILIAAPRLFLNFWVNRSINPQASPGPRPETSSGQT